VGSSESGKKCRKWKSCSDALQEEPNKPKKYFTIYKDDERCLRGHAGRPPAWPSHWLPLLPHPLLSIRGVMPASLLSLTGSPPTMPACRNLPRRIPTLAHPPHSPLTPAPPGGKPDSKRFFIADGRGVFNLTERRRSPRPDSPLHNKSPV